MYVLADTVLFAVLVVVVDTLFVLITLHKTRTMQAMALANFVALNPVPLPVRSLAGLAAVVHGLAVVAAPRGGQHEAVLAARRQLVVAEHHAGLGLGLGLGRRSGPGHVSRLCLPRPLSSGLRCASGQAGRRRKCPPHLPTPPGSSSRPLAEPRPAAADRQRAEAVLGGRAC